jgi:hypothetical protein
MSVSEGGSYFSRFVVKFTEIVAVSLATAVSGYLVAHLGGLWPSSASTPPPHAAHVAPSNAGTGAVAIPPVKAAQPSQPAQSTQQAAPSAHPTQTPPPAQAASQPPQPAAPVAIDSEPRPAPQEATTSTAQQGRRPMHALKAAPAHKPAKVEPSVAAKIDPNADAKAAKTDAAAAESKRREEDSVAAQVRAALANVDATRPPPEASPRPVDGGVGAATVPPRPVDVAPAVTGALPPRPADAQPQPARPAPAAQAPLQPLPVQQVGPPAPLSPVEVKSRPIAGVDAPTDAAPPAEEEKNMFSVFDRMLRSDRPAPPNEAPRPPMPVGQ